MFSSIGGHRKVINNRNRLYGQGSTPKCLHKQGIITAQTTYLGRKIKQTTGKEDMIIRSNRPMEEKRGCLIEQTNVREEAMIHKYHVYIFPKGKQSTICIIK